MDVNKFGVWRKIGIFCHMNTKKLFFFRLICWLLPETRCFALKRQLLRWCGAHVGDNVCIVSGAEFAGNGNLSIGNDVFIGAGSRFVAVAPAGIELGDCIDIAPRVMILTGTHEVDSVGARVAGKGVAKDVKIGSGCWLCAGSMILPGVEIAPRTLVAAGAVVTRSVARSNTKIGGVPAKEL